MSGSQGRRQPKPEERLLCKVCNEQDAERMYDGKPICHRCYRKREGFSRTY